MGDSIAQSLLAKLWCAVPAKKAKRRRHGLSTGLPIKSKHRGHIWTWNFNYDATKRGLNFEC